MENLILVNGSDQFIFENIGESPEGFEYPTIRTSIEDLAGDRSAAYVASKFGRRRLSWKALITGNATTVSVLRRNLSYISRPGSLKTLKFETCDGLDLQTYVEIEKIFMPYKIGARCEVLIEAVAPQWQFYSQTLHTFETAQTFITGGLAIPAAIPYDMSGTSNTNIVIENVGNYAADPIFTINGPGTLFTVQNQTTGESFVIDYTLTVGQTIVIDVNARTIILNGSTNIYSSMISGDFWQVQPGDNVVTFNAANNTGDTLLTIAWRDSYIGI